ncbi:MAG TPA: lysophospholipid acyltransferase family protein [Candidatus Baltobacteraceae bacterium]|jgi:1-acyl-sn-glycerol-3-phosphate acyltransferase|nr:lysophospholipid acyltransferase family protein [Candidatus Baltobacteraceae bacterium]
MRIIGAERVPRTGALIVVANHVSNLDPPVLGSALPRPLSYMAKLELFQIPVLGLLISHLNSFPVDRRRGDVAAIRRSVEELRRGAALAIFPEGGRNRDGTAVAHNGASLLAELSGAPVLPAYIGGTDRSRNLARITVVFGEVLHFEENPTEKTGGAGKQARREELANRTLRIMKAIGALREQAG